MATATKQVPSTARGADVSGRLSQARRMRLVPSGKTGGAYHWNIVSRSGVKLAELGRSEAHDHGDRVPHRVRGAAGPSHFQADAAETLPPAAA
jgi:hypothetical protein